MGCFNATCIVSNLPIQAGDPVRYLALAKNAFNNDGSGHCCYVTGRWQLHGVPIKAEYNDYGSVENIEPGFTTSLFFKGLAMAAVEVGTGDNSCHDVPVRADMDVDQWLNALWEGRVKVSDRKALSRKIAEARALDEKLEELTGSNPKLASIYEPKEPTVGIPSFRRIEKVLAEAGLQLSTGGFAAGLLVDEVGSGYVRVRRGGYEQKPMDSLLPILHGAGYAAMITAGSGSYAHNMPEILVAPLPSSDPEVHIHVSHDEGDESNLARPVSAAMIREDVWQILVNTPIENWSGKYDIVGFKAEAMRMLDQELAKAEELKAADASGDHSKAFRLAMRMNADFDINPRENIFRGAIRGSEGVSGFSFREAFRFGVEQGQTPEEIREYVINLAETVWIQWVYSQLHGQWHPTTNSSQDGNWIQHRAFLLALTEIKGKWEETGEEEDEEEDEETEGEDDLAEGE